jgi:hypothetical protein
MKTEHIMKINEIIVKPVTETTSSSSIGTAMVGGKGINVGSLFGGSYKPKTPFTAKKKVGKK